MSGCCYWPVTWASPRPVAWDATMLHPVGGLANGRNAPVGSLPMNDIVAPELLWDSHPRGGAPAPRPSASTPAATSRDCSSLLDHSWPSGRTVPQPRDRRGAGHLQLESQRPAPCSLSNLGITTETATRRGRCGRRRLVRLTPPMPEPGSRNHAENHTRCNTPELPSRHSTRLEYCSAPVSTKACASRTSPPCSVTRASR